MAVSVSWVRGELDSERVYPAGFGPSRADVVCRRGEAALKDGRLSEAERCFVWLLDVCNDPPPALRCRALAGAGAIARMRGQDTRAAALMGQALSVSTGYRYHDVLARAARDLGLLSAAAGRVDAARDWLEAAAVAYRPVLSPERARCLLELAQLHDAAGDWTAMERSCRDALRALPRRSLRDRISGYLLLSRSLLGQRRPDALPAARRALWLARIAGRDLFVKAMLAVADAAAMSGDYRGAARIYARAYRAAKRNGTEDEQAGSLLGLGRVMLEKAGRPQVAYDDLRAAAGLFSRTRDNARLVETLGLLVSAAQSAGLIRQAGDFKAWLDSLTNDGPMPEYGGTGVSEELRQASSI